MKIHLIVNGQGHDVDVPPAKRLLDVLREDLRLTGTKEGCGEGECGTCTVLLERRAVNSCLVPVVQCQGKSLETIEGVSTDPALEPLRQAFLEEGASQCGACTPGMIVNAAAYLRDEDPSPSPRNDRQRIREALAGTLCRCTGYESILRAVAKAAKTAGAVKP